MKSIADMTRAELTAYIQSHLRNNDIEVVLSGGSAVSIYSGEKYVSLDLDLVTITYSRRSKIRQVMLEIGFHQIGRHFEHPETRFLVEFPSGPLSVGRQPVSSILIQEYETGTLKIISPEDCVKDRLAAYYHWGDRQALAQALIVTKEQSVALSTIALWSQAEGKIDEYKKIESLLIEATSPNE